MWDLFFKLSKGGLTLFITTHYMDEAERCTKLGYIFNGRLIAYGYTEELSKSRQSLEDLFVNLTRTEGQKDAKTN